jgi:hypothetical protein
VFQWKLKEMGEFIESMVKVALDLDINDTDSF